MAQSGLRSFYPVRRHREDDTQSSSKRRKLTSNSHLEVPANEEQLDTSDFSNGTSAKKPATRSRTKKAGGKGADKKIQSGRGGKRCKKHDTMDVPNIKTLFEIINQSTGADEAPPTTDTLNDKLSDECLPSKAPSLASKSSSVASPSGQRSLQQSTTTPHLSPFKVPATPPKDSRSKPTTPKGSPMKAGALLPASPHSSAHVTSSPIPESRGARLLRMAKEKMSTITKSPISKVASPTFSNDDSSSAVMVQRTTRMAARRKLLSNPDLPSATSGRSKSAVANFFPSKEQDRQGMVGELYKLSKRELAQPTSYESAKVKRREGASRSDGVKEKEEEDRSGGAKTPKLREFWAFEFVSPTKNEAAKTRLPAYEKFHALAQPVGPSVTMPTPGTPLPQPATPPVELPLPYSYQLLEEKFRCTDTVVSMLQKRKEICTFEKLKAAVQEMSRRQFEEKNLGQMKTVYPTAFNFRQEKNIPGHFDKNRANKYHLTVECRLENGEQDDRIDSNVRDVKQGDPKSVRSTLNATTLIKRRKRFNRNLTEIAKKHHKAFLASLNPPLHIPDDKILRWHPAFALDSVPVIEAAPLPSPPIKETYTTAKDVLNVAQNRLAERVQAALANAAGESSSEAGDSGKGERVVKSEESRMTNPELRGVSTALLEKIRAKEATKAKLTITRDPVKEKQLEMLSRLPDFVRIIRGFFVTEKKAALLREDVVKKLVDSHPSRLPPDKVESHLQYLLEVLPEWIKSVKVSKGVFIKVDKKLDNKIILEKLEGKRALLSRQN